MPHESCVFQTYVFRISCNLVQKECCNKRLAWLLCYAGPGARDVIMCWLIGRVHTLGTVTDAHGALVGEVKIITGGRDYPIITLHYQISRIGSNPCLHSEKLASGWSGMWRRRICYLYSNFSTDKYCKCLENCGPYRNAHSLKTRLLYLGVLNSD